MTPSNSIRFVKLHLHNYGAFLGSHDFLFDQHRTFIVGPYGTGKTTLMSALVHLGPAPEATPSFGTDPSGMSVRVSTWGDRSLLKRYHGIVFLYEGPYTNEVLRNHEAMLADIRNKQHRKMIIDEAWDSFQALMPWKVEVNKYKDLDPVLLPASEKVCFAYAFAFAVRKVLDLDLPAVFDTPYDYLDPEKKSLVKAFLRKQPYQQILLVRENQFAEKDEKCIRI